MNDFIIDETTNTLTDYKLDIPNAHLDYLLIPHYCNKKQIDSIAPYCFGDTAIETLVIEKGIKKLQTRAFENSHCNNIQLPEGIEIDQYCFFDSNLREIALPNDLTVIKESTFARCKNLTSAKGGASIKVIGNQAFSYCNKLKELHFDYLDSIDDAAFIGCKNLQTIKLGNNIKHLGKYIFYECNNLQDITLIGSFDKLETDTFLGAGALKHLTLSTSSNSLFIPPHCFDETSLEEITFLGNFKPIIKERNCFPDNILIRAVLSSPAMELGYYFPIESI